MQHNILFVSRRNSIRSILAEQLINQIGQEEFKGFSAGISPLGQPHPLSLDILDRNGLETEGLRSKGIEDFTHAESPKMDFIFSLSESEHETRNLSPNWPGHPLTTHWSIADPTVITGNEVNKVINFRYVFKELRTRIEIFVSLPIATLDKLKLKNELINIERTCQNEVFFNSTLAMNNRSQAG